MPTPDSNYVKYFEVVVEDDNGRYFRIYVQATDREDARERAAYILDDEVARIVFPKEFHAHSAD